MLEKVREAGEALDVLLDHLANPPGGDADGKGYKTLHQTRLGSGVDWLQLREGSKADWAAL